MNVENKAREIVSALSNKPALFYAVLRIVRDEYEIASPWVESVKDEMWARTNENGRPLASVTLVNGEFLWQVSPTSGNGKTTTAQGGRAEADAILRDLGYLLP